MSKHPTVHFEFGDDESGTGKSLLRYDSGDSEQLQLTSLAHEIYRLEESAFAGDAVYGDIIRASGMGDGSLLFLEIVERSPLETQRWVMSPATLSADSFKTILNTVMEAGGMWEQVFGGLLLIHTPPSLARAVEADIAKASLFHKG